MQKSLEINGNQWKSMKINENHWDLIEIIGTDEISELDRVSGAVASGRMGVMEVGEAGAQPRDISDSSRSPRVHTNAPTSLQTPPVPEGQNIVFNIVY